MINNSSIALLGAATLIAAGSARAQQSSAPPVVGDVMVSGSDLVEEKPDGANGEPEWVRQRRYSLTRIYIQQDPGQIGVEQWYRARFYDGGRVTQRSQTEFEIGLPHRMQLDVYENILHDNTGGGWQQEEVAVELRYAFADWNTIPGNPTLYFEYAFAHDGPDAIEPKLLLGGELDKGWHWGLNFILEHELWGDKTTELGIAAGLSKTLVDDKLSVGIEGKASGVRGETVEAIFGPSIQWRPTPNTHLDVVALAGVTRSAPNAECWLIFGFDFGDGPSEGGGYKPTSPGGR